MTDQRLPASGAIRLRFAVEGAFANELSPTVTEANAALDIADGVSWNDLDTLIQASNTNNDPAITSKSNIADRGAAKYGGHISFYHPKLYGDDSNLYSVIYDALKTPRTVGYLIWSIDGDLSENNTPLYSGGATRDFAAGDIVTVMKVITGGYADAIVGEEAFRYTINFLPQGVLASNTVIRTSTVTVVVTPATLAATVVDGPVQLNATVNGRQYTRGLSWTVDNATLGTVSQNGVVTPIAAGVLTVTGTFDATGATDTSIITLT